MESSSDDRFDQFDQFDEDDKFMQTMPQMTSDIDLPADFKDRLLFLLEELEKETGEFFTLTVNKIGVYNSLALKPFEERSNYLIQNMKPEYESLNGIYPNLDAIKEKILKLKFGDSLCENDKMWKCPNCGQIKDERRSNGATIISTVLCQFCYYNYKSIWDYIGFSLKSRMVYKNYGGSVSICHPIGVILIQK